MPATPGLDFCGRVTGIHPSETTVKEGQRVFGAMPAVPKFGTLGQFIVVPRGQYALLPEGLTPNDAAAIGTAGLTAYQSLLPKVVKKSSKVFINGGSGGCGTYAIQFAKVMGAHVTTTCSTANVQLCKSLGADEVLDYKKVDFITELDRKGRIFDLAVDNVGTPSNLYQLSSKFLTPQGIFALVALSPTFGSIGGLAKKMLLPGFLGGGKNKFAFVACNNNTKDLDQIGKLVVEGKVKPVIDEVFRFEDVPAAFAKLREGRTKGKIVITVSNQ